MKCLALCLILAAGSCLAGLSRKNAYGKFYHSLADELKEPFLRYQLAVALIEQSTYVKEKPFPFTEQLLTPEGLGIPERTFSHLEALNPPARFSSRLYRLVTEDMGLSAYHVLDVVTTGEACTEKYLHCWDVGDVGSNCC